jgi:MurNAc alpha-1-phosphate uridylyltransferase
MSCLAPKRAMVLAAGRGVRMRPLTETLPKPLIEVGGRALVDRVIDRLEEAGVEAVAVNIHHLGHLIKDHLGSRAPGGAKISFSPEDILLDTGGGVARALPLLGDEPFFAANADVMWLNGREGALGRLAAAWDDRLMDCLLLIHSTVEAYGYKGAGDFTADPRGKLCRRPEGEVAPFVYTGVQILHPRLFDGAPEGPFSLNLLWDKAISWDRLHGIVHDGEWFDVGSPRGLEEAEAYMNKRDAELRHR